MNRQATFQLEEASCKVGDEIKGGTVVRLLDDSQLIDGDLISIAAHCVKKLGQSVGLDRAIELVEGRIVIMRAVDSRYNSTTEDQTNGQNSP